MPGTSSIVPAVEPTLDPLEVGSDLSPGAVAPEAPLVLRIVLPQVESFVLEVRGSVQRRPARLALTGELCAYSAPLLARDLERRVPDRDVVLDLWGLVFADSTGIATCVELGRRWRARGRSLHVANPSAAVCRVVSILHLEDQLFGGGDRFEPDLTDPDHGSGPARWRPGGRPGLGA